MTSGQTAKYQVPSVHNPSTRISGCIRSNRSYENRARWSKAMPPTLDRSVSPVAAGFGRTRVLNGQHSHARELRRQPSHVVEIRRV